ncbi:MAG: sugar ABC transporter permease [Defluviitaleaceae bacterium]|nr:sugar ABC transporter permease [Defluviitaleaceae bacterium]
MSLSLDGNGKSKRAILITSLLFMGLAHILFFKQYIKGAFFALVQIAMIAFLPVVIPAIHGLITLGEHRPELSVRYRDHSMFMMIEGVAVLAVIFIFLCIYFISVRSAQKTYKDYCENGRLSNNKTSIKEVFNQSFAIFGLAPSVLLVVFFVVVPLVFAALVAFTNYSSPHHIPPGNTVDWVGMDNFVSLFGGQTLWTSALLQVAIWTVVWAAAATFTCYFGGMIMAVIMKDFKVKFAPFFRSIFILPYAVPAVISMLVWRNLLNGHFGAINRTLQHFGIIEGMIPWLGTEAMVRFTVVMVNLWAGFPYFMLLTMGTMTAINQDLFEQARIDGASKWRLFRHITFPLVTYQTMPLIIMSFTHNINNFGAIFFLTGGQPAVAHSPISGATGADILITWIYRLTMETLQYHFAAVLAVMIFIILAPFAITIFVRTKSFREGEL